MLQHASNFERLPAPDLCSAVQSACPVVRQAKAARELPADRAPEGLRVDRRAAAAEISERRLQPGDVIPPERELTRVYRAGRSSVREALRMLESRGVIEDRRQRRRSRRRLREPAEQLAAAPAQPRPGDDARHLRAAPDPRMRGGGARGRAARRRAPRADGRRDRRDDAGPRRDGAERGASTSTATCASISRSPRRRRTA